MASPQSVTDLVTSRRARSPAQSQASGKPTMLQVLLQLASPEAASGGRRRRPGSYRKKWRCGISRRRVTFKVLPAKGDIDLERHVTFCDRQR